MFLKPVFVVLKALKQRTKGIYHSYKILKILLLGLVTPLFIMDIALAETFEITGVLNDKGVECPAMDGDDGRLYTIMGDLKGLSAGQRVRIKAKKLRMSYCRQGQTIEIEAITAEE